MERTLIWLLRVVWRLLKIDRFQFLHTLGERASIDFLPLAYHQRGILKHRDHESGETFFVKEVLASLFAEPITVFDVGANIGNYTAMVHENLPSANIYSFEPNADLSSRLEERVGAFAEVVKAAAGEIDGTMALYNCTEGNKSTHGSAYKTALTELHGYEGVEETTVPTLSLDNFAGTKEIQTVHFLKIDTEGHEFSVLKGCRELLHNKQIKIVQFEFNEMNVASRVFLKDFFELLVDYDFYRLDSVTLHPIAYSPQQEIFQFQNMICVRRDDPALDLIKTRFGSHRRN